MIWLLNVWFTVERKKKKESILALHLNHRWHFPYVASVTHVNRPETSGSRKRQLVKKFLVASKVASQFLKKKIKAETFAFKETGINAVIKNKLTAAQKAVLCRQNTTSSFASRLYSAFLYPTRLCPAVTLHAARLILFFFFSFQGNSIIPKLKIKHLEICGVLSVGFGVGDGLCQSAAYSGDYSCLATSGKMRYIYI